MEANFSYIWDKAYLPTVLVEDNGQHWIGRVAWLAKVYNLWVDWADNPLKKAVAMHWWWMTAMWSSGTSFQFISPEQFTPNPVIIVPPQWITIERILIWKWYVRRVQEILEHIIKRNTTKNITPCLWALVHRDKIQEVRQHIERAWYTEIGFQGWCHVFVHKSTQSVEQILVNSLWM